MLLSKNDWKELTNDNVSNDKYLLIFNVEKQINDIEFAKELAKQKNLKLKYINDRTLIKDKNIEYIEAPTPSNFINLFANAEIVVTNSFHGTVFSIIFEKEFYVELNNKKARNIRSEALLEKLNIRNREISSTDIFNASKINWKNVEKILDIERNKSKEYIIKINESSDKCGKN